jgi:hypothetical protein
MALTFDGKTMVQPKFAIMHRLSILAIAIIILPTISICHNVSAAAAVIEVSNCTAEPWGRYSMVGDWNAKRHCLLLLLRRHVERVRRIGRRGADELEVRSDDELLVSDAIGSIGE